MVELYGLVYPTMMNDVCVVRCWEMEASETGWLVHLFSCGSKYVICLGNSCDLVCPICVQLNDNGDDCECRCEWSYLLSLINHLDWWIVLGRMDLMVLSCLDGIGLCC